MEEILERNRSEKEHILQKKGHVIYCVKLIKQ